MEPHVIVHCSLYVCCKMSDLVGNRFTDGVWDEVSDMVWFPCGQRIGTGFEIRPALEMWCGMGFATGGGRHAIVVLSPIWGWFYARDQC